MRIQHNIMAMNAYRNYTNNTSALSKNLEKLSSGYKINRAGDDAAGLAISEKMRAQITGLDVAQKNAKDGISLIQTAEGALTEVHDMLNRMVELASQSANGTYDNDVDRANLQKEMDQLLDEVDRIADSSNFNGINLLDGSMSTTGSPSVKGTFKLPEIGTVLGVNTVLNKTNGAAAVTGTEFSIDLHNVGFANNTGESLVINVGKNKIELTGDGTGYMDGDAIIAAIVAGDAKINGETATGDASISFNDQAFTMSVGANGSTRLTFTQDLAPTSAEEEVSGAMKVTIEGAIVDGTQKNTGGTPDGTGDAASLTVTGTIQGTAQNGDTIQFTGTGLDVTFTTTDGTNWTTTDTVTGYTVAFDGTNLTITADANGEVAASPFGNITATVGGAGGVTDFTIGNAAGTWNTGTDDGITGGTWSGTELVDYNVSTTDIKNVYSDDNERLASTYFDLTKAIASNGGQITIGTTTYKFTSDEIYKDAGTTDNYVYIGDLDASASDYLTKVAERLTDEAETNTTYTVGHDGSRITITEIDGQTDFVKADGVTSSLDTLEGIAKSLSYKTSGVKGEGLTLQIGDTADSFNQLTVSISDMHAEALGLAGLDISVQGNAQTAIDKIKTAINTVSSVRGTLGATQNRLDHTINNLSVMQENIQDAESTIRDTDVAEEMMEYTKNNILIQSAQAMLAQANQVPQGVLQLLQ